MSTNTNLSTVADWLLSTTGSLKMSGVATARLDALVLLEDATGRDRAYLLAHSDMRLSDHVRKKLDRQAARRAQHEPLSYIRGKTEFYGREFIVSPDTLEPRPETETMIDLVKELKLPESPKIADVGAGSGAIGITLALEFPGSKVDLFEISLPAIKIAKQNMVNLKPSRASVHKSDLLSSAHTQYDLIAANLPYVPDGHTINHAAMQEPKIAIFGGPDGLDVYRRLFSQLEKLRPTYVLTESLPFQHQALVEIATTAGLSLKKTDDFIQLFSL